ncbi:hypothetical protein AAFF_G00264050 [Aldrovandia affinis]|uniref:Uncharacterized protein n=1 Tax=Aldrovandia affinis TaxID=143900 RepID=A0AAD7WT05_9TELE|nr:hypothetical protein AAFF_G00264050 [Aldrovandia affinis]
MPTWTSLWTASPAPRSRIPGQPHSFYTPGHLTLVDQVESRGVGEFLSRRRKAILGLEESAKLPFLFRLIEERRHNLAVSGPSSFSLVVRAALKPPFISLSFSTPRLLTETLGHELCVSASLPLPWGGQPIAVPMALPTRANSGATENLIPPSVWGSLPLPSPSPPPHGLDRSSITPPLPHGQALETALSAPAQGRLPVFVFRVMWVGPPPREYQLNSRTPSGGGGQQAATPPPQEAAGRLRLIQTPPNNRNSPPALNALLNHVLAGTGGHVCPCFCLHRVEHLEDAASLRIINRRFGTGLIRDQSLSSAGQDGAPESRPRPSRSETSTAPRGMLASAQNPPAGTPGNIWMVYLEINSELAALTRASRHGSAGAMAAQEPSQRPSLAACILVGHSYRYTTQWRPGAMASERVAWRRSISRPCDLPHPPRDRSCDSVPVPPRPCDSVPAHRDSLVSLTPDAQQVLGGCVLSPTNAPPSQGSTLPTCSPLSPPPPSPPPADSPTVQESLGATWETRPPFPVCRKSVGQKFSVLMCGGVAREGGVRSFLSRGAMWCGRPPCLRSAKSGPA